MGHLKIEQVMWSEGGLTPHQAELLRNAGLRLSFLERASIPLYRLPRGAALHRRSCVALQLGERPSVEERRSLLGLAQERLHQCCRSHNGPGYDEIWRWLRPALAFASVVAAVQRIEQSEPFDITALGEVLRYRAALEGSIVALTTGVLGTLRLAPRDQLLSTKSADVLRDRISSLVEQAQRGGSDAKLVSIAAASAGAAVPARSHIVAGAVPGDGAGRVLHQLWVAWCDALRGGHGFAAATSVCEELLRSSECRRLGLSKPLELDALLGLWRGELETRIAQGRTPVLLGVGEEPTGPVGGRLRGEFPSWPVAEAAWATVFVLPELVAEAFAAEAGWRVTWFGPGGARPEALAELVAGLWDGSSGTDICQIAREVLYSDRDEAKAEAASLEVPDGAVAG